VKPVDQPSQSHSFHSAVNYPLLKTDDFTHYSSNYVASFMIILQIPEPHSYSQAKDHPEWIAAMDRELLALEQNGTWILTALPQGKQSLTSKWVYKVKFRPDGSVE